MAVCLLDIISQTLNLELWNFVIVTQLWKPRFQHRPYNHLIAFAGKSSVGFLMVSRNTNDSLLAVCLTDQWFSTRGPHTKSGPRDGSSGPPQILKKTLN